MHELIELIRDFPMGSFFIIMGILESLVRISYSFSKNGAGVSDE